MARHWAVVRVSQVMMSTELVADDQRAHALDAQRAVGGQGPGLGGGAVAVGDLDVVERDRHAAVEVEAQAVLTADRAGARGGRLGGEGGRRCAGLAADRPGGRGGGGGFAGGPGAGRGRGGRPVGRGLVRRRATWRLAGDAAGEAGTRPVRAGIGASGWAAVIAGRAARIAAKPAAAAPSRTAAPAASTTTRRRGTPARRPGSGGTTGMIAVGSSAPSSARCDRTSRVVAAGQVWVDRSAAGASALSR